MARAAQSLPAASLLLHETPDFTGASSRKQHDQLVASAVYISVAQDLDRTDGKDSDRDEVAKFAGM